MRIENGFQIVGSKIGATSSAVQRQFGIYQPDFGMLFNDGRVEDGGEISVREIMQPKVEGEIAFVLSRDIDKSPIDAVEVISSISHAVVALELLGSRIKNWDISIADTIADNASGSHWVIGNEPKSLEKIDLVNCKMVMKKNGNVVSEGRGSNSLGSPINSALWLIRTLLNLNIPMKAGDFILSGSLGEVVDAKAGDKFSLTISGLGRTSVNFIE